MNIKKGLIKCFQKIYASGGFNAITVWEATTQLLPFFKPNASFLFWLKLVYKIMPHVDILYAQMQKHGTKYSNVESSFKMK